MTTPTKNNFITMDIFNKKKIKALEAEIQHHKTHIKLLESDLEAIKYSSEKQKLYYEKAHNGDIQMITESQATIADLNSKLTLANRLNEIYESKPDTEALENALKKNQETINMYIEREQAYIKRIEELESHPSPEENWNWQTITDNPVPIEEYNYGGKIPKRDPKTGRFVKS